MITLYFAPRTRSVRVLWLLEELGLPYKLHKVDFAPPTSGFFTQDTPLKKLPVIEDGDVVMCESGAILEYILERYGDGRLAPAIGSPLRGRFLQWVHFAEGSIAPSMSALIFHGLYKQDAASIPTVMEDARERTRDALHFLADGLGDDDYVLGDEFSAADIMLGFSLFATRVLGVLDDRFPTLHAYLGRLEQRPAYIKAATT